MTRLMTPEQLGIGRLPSRIAPSSLLDLSPDELVAKLREIGEPPYRASQILGWVYRELIFDYDRMTSLPKELRASLSTSLPILPLAARAEVASDEGMTRKALLELTAGSAVETVLMAYPARAGLGETGGEPGAADGLRLVAGRLRRRLPVLRDRPVRAAPQPVGRRDRRTGPPLRAARFVTLEGADARITNVVFMGQGEPLANFRAGLEGGRDTSTRPRRSGSAPAT